MRDLTKKLRRLGKAVNELTKGTINRGGCCVYAAAVAERLAEHGIHVEVIVPTYADAHTVEEARNNLSDPRNASPSDWVDAGLNFHHVGVRFRHLGVWYTHDTDITLRAFDQFGLDEWSGEPRLTALPDGMTPEEARACADEADGWNDCFDRDLIPDVRELVREHLS